MTRDVYAWVDPWEAEKRKEPFAYGFVGGSYSYGTIPCPDGWPMPLPGSIADPIPHPTLHGMYTYPEIAAWARETMKEYWPDEPPRPSFWRRAWSWVANWIKH